MFYIRFILFNITLPPFSNPNMAQGLFNSTFYILQEALNVDTINFRLNPIQSGLVDNIMRTEHIEWLKHELGAISNGLLYHKDHYEFVHSSRIHDYQPLIHHSNILIFFHLFHLCIFIFYFLFSVNSKKS